MDKQLWTSNCSQRTTLLIVMLAVTFGLLLLGLVVMVNWSADRPRRQSQCGKNMSHILGAMVASQATYEFDRWIVLERPLSASPTAAARARLYTTRLWEGMAAEQSLPNTVFSCPDSRHGRIKAKPRPQDPASTWGREPQRIIGYALDWAAGIEPGSTRPMIADRDPSGHDGSVMVAFGDAHVKRITTKSQPARATGTLVTEGVDGKPLPVGTALAPDDDIYSTEGDAGEPLTPGKGDPLRAWVK